MFDTNIGLDVFGLECYKAKDKANLLDQMKKMPPKHSDYSPPKGFDGKKTNKGWKDKKGRVWEPTDHKGTHDPHWDVQSKNGKTHETVYPNTEFI